MSIFVVGYCLWNSASPGFSQFQMLFNFATYLYCIHFYRLGIFCNLSFFTFDLMHFPNEICSKVYRKWTEIYISEDYTRLLRSLVKFTYNSTLMIDYKCDSCEDVASSENNTRSLRSLVTFSHSDNSLTILHFKLIKNITYH